MKLLIVGLGSMGKRRVRNLQALGFADVAGYDLRSDRREEAAGKYGIAVFDSYESALTDFDPQALVISTGPALHMDYALPAAERGLHCFIEASVVDRERILRLADLVKKGPTVVAPSCTMAYYPGPRKVKELIVQGVVGKPLNINYLTGQYLPDWHPWEHIQDFYVSDRVTGGCREIVPFELTWLNQIFGEPDALACIKDKLTEMPADIDDIYHCLLRYPGNVLANVTVEVISRPQAIRELHILGSEGRLVFSADENCVRYIRVGDEDWTRWTVSSGTVEAGYINPEEPYISEMRDFVEAVRHRDAGLFPNTLQQDAGVLDLLNRLEQLSESKQ